MLFRSAGTRDDRTPPLLAGRAVQARATKPCAVEAAEIAETTWYSGCSTYYFGTHGGAAFAVFYRKGGVRLAVQPVAPPSAVASIPVYDKGRLVATVFRLSRPVQ